ncbi:hypothetical protein Leryth_002802 [Lithospermum erythrorhizon]|uniref:Oxidoreductase n=1 Tax=Lithospermum erythrorhizon TaxID=34254 RepID=A0AAV3Q051_LITER|nr:hypothetical protein Leryth_002802 [Lithospermum erythrorhizon]
MASSNGTKKVVIVGGGVAGSVLAKSLQDEAEVYVIDPKEYFEITWATLRCMVEPSFAERSVINHTEYAPKAHLITSTATRISETEVTTANGKAIPYDYVVIATGHDDRTALTKSERIGHYKNDQEKIKKANSILVVGGGPTGVELAAEITVDFPGKKVTLVHKGPRLLEFLGEKASNKALTWLKKKNVEVLLGESVTNLDSNSEGGVYKTTGEKSVTADCHFLCIGKPLASSWLKETILKDCLDNKGRLMVDANLRVKGHTNIFAIGDITDINEMKQGYLAQMHSGVVAKNITSLASGKEKLEAYKGGPEMAIVSLGRKEAVAQISGMAMSGWIPGKIKSGDMFVSKTRKTLGLNSK